MVGKRKKERKPLKRLWFSVVIIALTTGFSWWLGKYKKRKVTIQKENIFLNKLSERWGQRETHEGIPTPSINLFEPTTLYNEY